MAKKIKVKTNRAAAKRFRVSGSGRVRRSKCGHSHGMWNKSRKRNRTLRKNDMVHGDHEKRIRLLLPYA
ncbi:MAG: 50S ribosomal protein L35 [Deltaproteobacteria bacterium]|nr:50S ribosomal protein L35 [Deltaproteobacteria bacterium]